MPEGVPVIIRRREPFEVIVLVLLLVTAVTQLLTKSPPGSVTALMPGWWALDWSVLTILGTCVALIGIWTPNLVTGLFMERLGISITSAILVIYGMAAAVFAGVTGLSATGLALAGMGAFYVRRREINQAIKRLPRNPSTLGKR